MKLNFVRLVLWLIPVFILPSLPAAAGTYREAPVPDGSVLKGKITFSGTVPPPEVFRIRDFANFDYCKKKSDGKGHRVVQPVRLGEGGSLQDAVIYIEGVEVGKPFPFDGTEVHSENCDFVVQGGPSPLVGVVVDEADLRVLNLDSDPTHPETLQGIKHNPQALEVLGGKKRLIFKLLISLKDQISRRTVKIKKRGSTVLLECDIHNYMRSYFLPVENPYYAVVEKDGTYKIDKIPPGNYEVTAWNPVLGKIQKEIKILPNEISNLDFAFKN